MVVVVRKKIGENFFMEENIIISPEIAARRKRGRENYRKYRIQQLKQKKEYKSRASTKALASKWYREERRRTREQRKEGNLKAFCKDKIVKIKKKINQGKWKRMGFAFDLTAEYLEVLYKKQGGKCYYSGEPLRLGIDGDLNVKDNPYMISLDRIDSNRGYIQGNVVFCTFAANSAKNLLSESDFFRLVKKIYTTMRKRQSKLEDGSLHSTDQLELGL